MVCTKSAQVCPPMLSNLLSGNVSRSNVERLAGIIFCLDAICRVVFFEIGQAAWQRMQEFKNFAYRDSRILRTEEFEELLLAWMCTVLEHGSLSTR